MKSTMDIVFDEEGVCDLGTDYNVTLKYLHLSKAK